MILEKRESLYHPPNGQPYLQKGSLLESRSGKWEGWEEPSTGSWAGPRLVKPNADQCLSVKRVVGMGAPERCIRSPNPNHPILSHPGPCARKLLTRAHSLWRKVRACFDLHSSHPALTLTLKPTLSPRVTLRLTLTLIYSFTLAPRYIITLRSPH